MPTHAPLPSLPDTRFSRKCHLLSDGAVEYIPPLSENAKAHQPHTKISESEPSGDMDEFQSSTTVLAMPFFCWSVANNSSNVLIAA